MSVENEARPQGPSKLSRRNLIAGAAVAVPAAAVLNASSAWAKPVVNSLIGMPALVASTNYTFGQLFSASVGAVSTQPKKINVPFTLTNKSGEPLTAISINASVTKSGAAALSITGAPSPFMLANGASQPMTFVISWASPPKPEPPLPKGVYSVTLNITASGNGVTKGVVYAFEVEITKP